MVGKPEHCAGQHYRGVGQRALLLTQCTLSWSAAVALVWAEDAAKPAGPGWLKCCTWPGPVTQPELGWLSCPSWRDFIWPRGQLPFFLFLHFWSKVSQEYFQTQNVGFLVQAELTDQKADITKLEQYRLLPKNHSGGNRSFYKPNQLVLQEVTRPAPLKPKHWMLKQQIEMLIKRKKSLLNLYWPMQFKREVYCCKCMYYK